MFMSSWRQAEKQSVRTPAGAPEGRVIARNAFGSAAGPIDGAASAGTERHT